MAVAVASAVVAIDDQSTLESKKKKSQSRGVHVILHQR